MCTAPSLQFNWQARNQGYAVTQFYHGSVDPQADFYIGGTQDTGVLSVISDAAPDDWTDEELGGVGGYSIAFTELFPVEADIVYAALTEFTIMKSIDGGPFQDVSIDTADDSLFIVPLVVDPNLSRRLWAGGERMWRTENAGGSWVAKNQSFANADLVSANMRLGYELRVSSTPTIMVQGNDQFLMLPGATFPAIQAAVEQISASADSGGAN